MVPLLLFAGSFVLYQYDVDQPPQIVFDEAHYVKVARNYTNNLLLDPKWTDAARPQNFEHPPVGKYLIALGIWINGKPNNEYIHDSDPGEANQRYIDGNKPGNRCGHHNPDCAGDARGWRLLSTIVGASGIAAAYLLGLRLFNNQAAGLFSAGLLLVDGLYFLQARLAMLDIFVAGFSLWALAYAFSPRRRGPWLSAVFLGLAVASKYNALFLVPFVGLVHFMRARVPAFPAHLLAEDHAQDSVRTLLRHAWERTRPWLSRVGFAVAFGLVLPLLLVVASYAPYFQIWYEMGGPGHAIQQWIFVQVQAFTWDFAGEATHSYWSAPGTWLPLIRPVWYYNLDPGTGMVGKIYSVGNPFLWWSATLALAAAAAWVVTQLALHQRHAFRWTFWENLVFYRFPMGSLTSFGLAVLLFVVLYFPWFLLQRISFLYYMTTVVPAFAFIMGGLLGLAWARTRAWKGAALGYLGAAALVFGLYYPVLTGTLVEASYFRWVMGLVPWMRT